MVDRPDPPDGSRPSEPPASHESSAPPAAHEEREHRRRRLEGVIPDLLKRAVELGVEKAAEAPESWKQMLDSLRLPKEVVGYLLAQVEETKNASLRVVAKETREFLEHANLGAELSKVLTTLQFEINTTIRFRPNEGGKEDDDETDEHDDLPKPEVKLDVFARKRKKKEG